MTKKKLGNIFLYFILLQPVFDIMTSVANNVIELSISLNTIIKSLFLLLLFIYLIFYSKSKYRKISITYLLLFVLYILFYFITKLDINGVSELINEVTYIFKYNYWIFLLIGYINLFTDQELDRKKLVKCLQVNAILYFIFLVIPLITNTSMATYSENEMGHKGWFYAANELACLLSLLVPLLFLCFSKKQRSWFDYLSIILGIIAMVSIGLKTTYASLLLTTLFLIIYLIVKNRKNYKTYIILSVLLFLFAIGYNKIPGFDIWTNNNYAASLDISENDTFVSRITTTLFHTRKPLFFEKKSIYDSAQIQDKLFGIGFTNREKYGDARVFKLVEIDPADIFFGYGLVGFTIYILPFIYMIVLLLKQKFENIVKFENLLCLYVLVLGIIISVFSGHIFGAPSASIYLVIAYLLLFLSYQKKDKTKQKSNT